MTNTQKYSKPISIRFPPGDLDRLVRLSEETGHPLQSLVRACVARALPYVERKAHRSPKVQPAAAGPAAASQDPA